MILNETYLKKAIKDTERKPINSEYDFDIQFVLNWCEMTDVRSVTDNIKIDGIMKTIYQSLSESSFISDCCSAPEFLGFEYVTGQVRPFFNDKFLNYCSKPLSRTDVTKDFVDMLKDKHYYLFNGEIKSMQSRFAISMKFDFMYNHVDYVDLSDDIREIVELSEKAAKIIKKQIGEETQQPLIMLFIRKKSDNRFKKDLFLEKRLISPTDLIQCYEILEDKDANEIEKLLTYPDDDSMAREHKWLERKK